MSGFRVRQGDNTWYPATATDTLTRVAALTAMFPPARWGPIEVAELADPAPAVDRRRPAAPASAAA